MRGALTALLIGLTPLPAAAAAEVAVLWEDGPARVVLRDGARVVAERVDASSPRLVEARLGEGVSVRGASPSGAVAVQRGRLVLVTADTSHGRRLIGFVLDERGGWRSAGSVPVGPGPVSVAPALAAPDPAFPAPAPLIPLRVVAGRLAADAEALPVPVPQALAPGRCPGGPAAATVEDAARLVRALPEAEAEAAALRAAACLVLAARPFEARRVLGLALGREGAARALALEAELAGRLACSPHLAAIRRASPPEKTFLLGACAR